MDRSNSNGKTLVVELAPSEAVPLRVVNHRNGLLVMTKGAFQCKTYLGLTAIAKNLICVLPCPTLMFRFKLL